MPYASIIAGADLKTHIYANILDEITRKDDTIIDKGIDTAIAEAKIYLSRYDLVQLFGDQQSDTAASFSDPYLISLVKDLAVWQVLKLGKPNVLTENQRKCYEDALKTLMQIQKGQANPAWPYIDSSITTAPDAGDAIIIANDPRENHW